MADLAEKFEREEQKIAEIAKTVEDLEVLLKGILFFI